MYLFNTELLLHLRLVEPLQVAVVPLVQLFGYVNLQFGRIAGGRSEVLISVAALLVNAHVLLTMKVLFENLIQRILRAQ